MRAWWFLALGMVVSGLTWAGSEISDTGFSTVDSDTDSEDTDVETNVSRDTDAATDTDADTDTDSESGADTDSEPDTDTAVPWDTQWVDTGDLDTGEADTDTDSDTDVDVDTDTDVDTGFEITTDTGTAAVQGDPGFSASQLAGETGECTCASGTSGGLLAWLVALGFARRRRSVSA